MELGLHHAFPYVLLKSAGLDGTPQKPNLHVILDWTAPEQHQGPGLAVVLVSCLSDEVQKVTKESSREIVGYGTVWHEVENLDAFIFRLGRFEDLLAHTRARCEILLW